MVLPFDQLLAAEGARLSLRFVKMGLVPELASSHFIVTRCGWGAASWLALSGTTVFADEAFASGWSTGWSPPDTLLDEAVAVRGELGSNPGPQVRMIKELLTINATEGDLAAVQQREIDAIQVAYRSPEHREAVTAFMEKREPNFRQAASRILSPAACQGLTRTIVVPTVTPPEKVDEGARSRIEPLVVGGPGPQLSRIDPTIELGAGLAVAVADNRRPENPPSARGC